MDIVDRLRSYNVAWSQQGEDCAAAADEIENLRSDIERLQAQIQFQQDAFREVIEERDALKADAERYRWLRQRIEVRNERVMSGAFRRCIGTRIGSSVIDAPLPFTATPEQREAKMQELDAAIDAARGE